VLKKHHRLGLSPIRRGEGENLRSHPAQRQGVIGLAARARLAKAGAAHLRPRVVIRPTAAKFAGRPASYFSMRVSAIADLDVASPG
jgi:hypothetical protein